MYTAFKYMKNFNFFYKRLYVLVIETGSPYLVLAALDLLYCLMDLKPVIYLSLLKMFVKTHQV
jgi:hypothetical protein